MPYPIVVNLAGKTVVVVGGGTVATRRIESLLVQGATVTVVAPETSPVVAQWASSGHIAHIDRGYAADDINGAFMVHAATDSREVNATVTAEANARGILVCCADDPAAGSFSTPATIERGTLLIALMTGGESPSLTAVLRERLETQFGPEYDLWVQLFGRLREAVQLIAGSEHRKAKVRTILSDPTIESLILAGQLDEAEMAARQCI